MSYFNYEPEHVTDDPGFLRLTAEAGYIYMMLANRMLRHGPLSPDKEFYRLLWGSRCRRFNLAWDQATSVIDRDSDGFLVISWALDARLEADAVLKSDRARKAKARSEARERTVSAGLPPDVCGTSAGRPLPTDGRTDGTDGQTDRRSADEPAPPARRVRSKPTGDHAECIQHWEAEWQRTRLGTKYPIQSKDAVAIAWMLKQEGPQEVRRRMTAILEDQDGWTSERASVGLLRARWTQYAVRHIRAVSAPTGFAAVQSMLNEMRGGQ